jgi:PAS domain S-box-containing protein
MNKLLQRQLIKRWGSIENVPAELLPFLETIALTYDHHDKDRTMLERSIDLSSRELVELNQRLHEETQELEKAHKELKTLFDNIETVFFTVDLVQHKVTQMSESCEKIYGYTAQEFLDNSHLWFTVIPDEDKPLVEKNYAVMHAGETFSHSHRIVAKDGTIRWIESKVTPTLNAARKVIRIDGTTTDITAKKAAEDESRRQEARYRNLIEKSHDGISLLGMDGKLLYVSPSVERILGYDAAELIGVDPGQFTHPEDMEQLVKLLTEIMQRPGESKRAVYRMKNKLGEWRWISSTISNLLHDESVNALVFNYEDITQQRVAEQQIEFDRRNRDALINNTSDLIWSFDSSRRLITANKGFLYAMKIVSGTELKPGDNLLDENIFPPAVIQKWTKLYDRVLRGDSFVYENHEVLPFDQWAELSFRPIYENQKIIGATCTWHDITEKKNQSERLIASEKMMAEAQRISRFGSWELKFNDNEQIIHDSVVWSKEVFRIFGFDTDEYSPDYHSVMQHVYPEDIPAVNQWLNEAIHDKSPDSLDCRIFASDGSTLWIKVTAGLFRDEQTGTKLKLLGTIQDITERKSLELERAEAIEDLLQRNKDLEQFAHIVSHNLRAPVANILGLAHLLRLSESDPQTREQCISGLAISAQRLDDIIKDLNKILQVKRGMTEDKMVVDFGTLVQNIAESIQMQIEQAEVTISTDFSAVAEMYTIKNYLHSVFYNLISNSIKYRRPTVKPVITITSKVDAGKTILSFKDNCMGIDLEKHRDQVFGLYKRFHHDIDGKGLGMYMVKTQVESLGGKVAIDSKVNEGTEITIEFAAAS